jgi:hypothetical protein
MVDDEIEKLKKEGEELIKNNDLSDTRVQFIRRHIGLLEGIQEIKEKLEKIERKIEEGKGGKKWKK